jgi:hypothetical protein
MPEDETAKKSDAAPVIAFIAAAPATTAALAPELAVDGAPEPALLESASFTVSFPHALNSEQTRHGFFFAFVAFVGFSPALVGCRSPVREDIAFCFG